MLGGDSGSNALIVITHKQRGNTEFNRNQTCLYNSEKNNYIHIII